jgi:hypothetical protein
MRTGSVMSAFSVARRAESAPRSSSALRPSSASPTRALRPLTAWPKALRCSAGSVLGHQLGHAALLAERGDAHALDCGQVRRRADLGDQRPFDGGDLGFLRHLCHPGACPRDPALSECRRAR